ncbi:hypothetical protein FRC07_012135, partial [Ceratobasidium sp. 392]
TPVDRPTHRDSDVWEAAEAGGESFVGRPLNLDDGTADVHLARLRAWGFNCIRFAFTWEAIEHEGPGKYDHEYIAYTIRVLRRCKEFGFRAYMNPHQDVWSRFSGGSGAPCWTFVACGLNPRNFTTTQAALLHFEHPDPASYPAMIWGTNNERFVAPLMFTLFFAGRDFAPRCVIDGVNIQDWLQRHFIDACGTLADAIRAAGDLYDVCVIGWDSLNEPGAGLIGTENLHEASDQSIKQGTHPSPAQAILLGNGIPQKLKTYRIGMLGPQRSGSQTVDPKGQTVWSMPETEEDVGDGSGDRINRHWGWRRAASWPLGECIWAMHGVWAAESNAKGEGRIVKPDYFKTLPTDPEHTVNFIEDYWRPHWRAYSARIRQAHPEAIFFLQPPVFTPPPSFDEDDLKGRAAYSAHFYDALTTLTRRWNFFNSDALGLVRGHYSSGVLGTLRIGTSAVRNVMRHQLRTLKNDPPNTFGPYPTIIGETGVPMNLHSKRSYATGDYTNQTRALDCSLNAADGSNVLNWTLWNYQPDNTHQWGDGWNLEDFSIWSTDDAGTATPFATTQIPTNRLYEFVTSGARGVGAFSRPWPIATVGTPIHLEFDIEKACFEMRVRVRQEDRAERADEEELGTEVYIPLVHFATDSVFEGKDHTRIENGEIVQNGQSPSHRLSGVLSP